MVKDAMQRRQQTWCLLSFFFIGDTICVPVQNSFTFFPKLRILLDHFTYICPLPFHFFFPFSPEGIVGLEWLRWVIEVDVTSTAEVTYTGDGCVKPLKDVFFYLLFYLPEEVISRKANDNERLWCQSTSMCTSSL